MKHLLVSLFALMSALTAFAGDAREELLGQVDMKNFGYTNAVEFRGACPSEENRPVEKLQFRVYRKNVDIDRFEVWFNDGRHEVFPVRERFARDTVSGWFHLNGVRCVRKFQLVGTSEGFPVHEHAEVQVWGLRHHHW